MAPLAAGPGRSPSLTPGGARTQWQGDLPLVTALSSPAAPGRHRATCDQRNRQPQNGDTEPQGAGAPLPLAPHCLGRLRGVPTHPEPLENQGHGDLRGCCKQQSRLTQHSSLPQPCPQGWQRGVAAVAAGPPSTAVPPCCPRSCCRPALQPRAPGSGRRQLGAGRSH